VELWPPQQRAVDGVVEAWRDFRSTVVVMPTGTGKTEVGAELVRRSKGRALWLAHRGELLDQAEQRLQEVTKAPVLREQAGAVAWPALGEDSVVVASVQTMCQPHRLQEYRANDFDLVVADEAHHFPSESGRRILDHFSAAKVVGLTATPDRHDRVALGTAFESVAFVYEILDAVRDGYLCPIRQQRVLCSMDLSRIPTTDGDLDLVSLEQELIRNPVLKEVAVAAVDLAGDRRTMVFCAGVTQAHAQARALNAERPGCARAVDGETPKDVRRETIAAWRAGVFQFLCNCNLYVEGFDEPALACIVMARPTKSRLLYAQMLGRGLRQHPGKVNVLVLDFLGVSGRHKLVNVFDVLGGREPLVYERAKRIAEGIAAIDVEEALRLARIELDVETQKRLAAESRAVRRALSYTVVDVDPFGILRLDLVASKQRADEFGVPRASDRQVNLLTRMKFKVPLDLDRQSAQALIRAVMGRKRRGLCSFGKAKWLKSVGLPHDIPADIAERVLDALKARGGKRFTPRERIGWAKRIHELELDNEQGGRSDDA